jgi:hypothetical protein
MKIFNQLLLGLMSISVLNCNHSPRKEKQKEESLRPLIGIIYDSAQQVEQLKNFKDIAGGVIDVKNSHGDYEYCISRLVNENKNIVTFEKFISYLDNSRHPQIIDTININVKEGEYVSLCNCRQDTTLDSEIIALVAADFDQEYFKKIIKAWRADTKAQKLVPIKNTNGIKCYNEGYGAY